MNRLVVVDTHPVQYRAPLYALLQKKFHIPVAAVYGSDFSVVGYIDKEFNKRFSWDTDLLSGYDSVFLSRVLEGGAKSVEKVSAKNIMSTISAFSPRAVLLVGYSPLFYQNAFFQLLKIKPSCAIFFRGETTDHTSKHSFFRSLMRDLALRFFYSKCTKIFYVGKHSLGHFKRLGIPEKKLSFSPYAVDTEHFESDELQRDELRCKTRSSLNIDENDLVFLFSGKLSLRKGVDMIFPMLQLLKKEIKQNIAVIFLGSGNCEENLKKQYSGQQDISAYFVGFQNQTKLSGFYHASDILLLPSRNAETWGLVVNEAMHHGLPCVVSDAVGCAPDLILSGETGEIFKTDVVADFAEAVKKVLVYFGDSEKRTKRRERMKFYSIDVAAQAIAKAYYAL